MMLQWRQVVFERFVPPSADEARIAEEHLRNDGGRHNALQTADMQCRVCEPRLPHGELLSFNAKGFGRAQAKQGRRSREYTPLGIGGPTFSATVELLQGERDPAAAVVLPPALVRFNLVPVPRRARGRCVTVAVDGTVFHTPVHVGDEESVYADLISTGRTFMKFQVEAWRRSRDGDEQIQVTDAVFTFMATDSGSRPRPLLLG